MQFYRDIYLKKDIYFQEKDNEFFDKLRLI